MRFLEGFCPMWYAESTMQSGDGQKVTTNSEVVLQESDYKMLSTSYGQLKPFKPLRKWSPSSRHPTEKSVDNLESYSSLYSSLVVQEKKVQTFSANSKCNAKVTIKLSPKPFVTVQHQQAISYENMLGR